MAGASMKQWEMGLDVVRYLKGAKELGLTYRWHKGYMDMSVMNISNTAADEVLEGVGMRQLEESGRGGRRL
jgi:hypothetical protein